MAASILIPVEEYLRTCYRPDRDYIDGEVRERIVGERDHSRTQGRLMVILANLGAVLNFEVFPEHRVQVAARRFRIPDLSVALAGSPEEPIFRTPPYLCIEILSTDDTMDSMEERIQDYLGFGVAFVWVINPRLKSGWIYTKQNAQEAMGGILRAGEIQVVLTDLFAN